MWTRIVSFSCLIALCSSVLATEVRLGPEIPLVKETRFGAAAYAQYQPVLASNGDEFLAFWLDERQQTVVKQLYRARLDQRGHPAERFGRRFASVWSGQPMIASDGNHYLVLWRSSVDSAYYVQPLDENGSATAAAIKLDSSLTPRALASNGASYLLVASEGPQHTALAAVLMNRDGVIVDKKPLRLRAVRFDGWASTLGVANGRYEVIGYEADCYRCATTVLRTIEERDGALSITESTLEFMPPPEALNHVSRYLPPVITDDRLFFSWSARAGEIQFTIVDRAGRTLTPVTTVNVESDAHEVLWDGREFLLVFRDDSVVRALRIRPDGSLPMLAPYPLSSSGWLPSFATNGSTRLLMWVNGENDLVQRTVSDFSELAAGPAADNVVWSALPENYVQLAAQSSRTMAVWMNEAGDEIRAAIDGAEMLVAKGAVGAPAIAAGATQFIVAWSEVEAGEFLITDRLFARRYSVDGTPLDPLPVLIAEASNWTTYGMPRPGVAADGDGFVFSFPKTSRDASSATFQIDLLRFEGGITTLLATYPCPSGQQCWYPFAPMKTGAEWTVPYLADPRFGSPDIGWTWRLYLAPRKESTPLIAYDWDFAAMGIAEAGDRVAFTMPALTSFVASSGIRLVQRSGAMTLVPQTADASATDIAWNGSEYVLAWTTFFGGPILAMRLDVNGRPLDAAPIELAPDGSTNAPPSIAATDRGVVIAYSRCDPSTGGAPRAFTRTLDALPPPVMRRPAVRH